MGKSITELSSVAPVGLDLAKNAFQVHAGITGDYVRGITVRLAYFPYGRLSNRPCRRSPLSGAGIGPHRPVRRSRLAHHVTQRGNRRERVFFGDEDYALYRDLLSEACRREGVAVWSYCLMPNHVHLILTPRTPEGLGRALGPTAQYYGL